MVQCIRYSRSPEEIVSVKTVEGSWLSSFKIITKSETD